MQKQKRRKKTWEKQRATEWNSCRRSNGVPFFELCLIFFIQTPHTNILRKHQFNMHFEEERKNMTAHTISINQKKSKKYSGTREQQLLVTGILMKCECVTTKFRSSKKSNKNDFRILWYHLWKSKCRKSHLKKCSSLLNMDVVSSMHDIPYRINKDIDIDICTR